VRSDPTAPALLVRAGPTWQAISHATVVRRIEEYAFGLRETGCRPGDALALDAAHEAEAVLLAAAALRAGLVVRLGPAESPFAAAIATDPARAAELASSAGIDPVRVPVPSAQDTGASLERLAAHGVLLAALQPTALEPLPADAPALTRTGGPVLTVAELAAGVRALREVGDLLRPGGPVLIARRLEEPWLLTLALAALEVGAPVAIGRLADAETIAPDVVVASKTAVEGLARDHAGGSQSARARSLRIQRGGVERHSRLVDHARLIVRRRRVQPVRAMIVADGRLTRDLCTDLHVSGTLVLHAATTSTAAAPILMNRPHRYRFDVLGLPLPEHVCTIVDGQLEASGPGIAGGWTRTAIAAQPGPDCFIAPDAP